jgi:hypothetical protein
MKLKLITAGVVGYVSVLTGWLCYAATAARL